MIKEIKPAAHIILEEQDVRNMDLTTLISCVGNTMQKLRRRAITGCSDCAKETEEEQAVSLAVVENSRLLQDELMRRFH